MALDEGGQEEAEAGGVEAAPVYGQTRAVCTQVGDEACGGVATGAVFVTVDADAALFEVGLECAG